MIEEVRNSLRGKSAIAGLMFLLPFLFIVDFFYRDGFYNGNGFGHILIFLISNVNSLIHELGHFSMMGLSIFGSIFYNDYTFWKDMTVISGTGFQVGWPIVALIIMYKNKEYLGVAFCFIWLAISVYHSAWYMASARSDGVYASSNFLGKLFDAAGKKGEHDWFWMFKRINMLDYDVIISGCTKDLSFILLLIGLIGGFFIIYQTWKVNRY